MNSKLGEGLVERGKVNPERRALYKEAARRIVGADRAARKHGASQNTIGEIERALVAAFLDGCEHGRHPDTGAEATELTWVQVPPRSRDTLLNLTFWFSRRLSQPRREPSQIERFEQGDKRRWRMIDAKGSLAEHSVADGSGVPPCQAGAP